MELAVALAVWLSLGLVVGPIVGMRLRECAIPLPRSRSSPDS